MPPSRTTLISHPTMFYQNQNSKIGPACGSLLNLASPAWHFLSLLSLVSAAEIVSTKVYAVKFYLLFFTSYLKMLFFKLRYCQKLKVVNTESHTFYSLSTKNLYSDLMLIPDFAVWDMTDLSLCL